MTGRITPSPPLTADQAASLLEEAALHRWLSVHLRSWSAGMAAISMTVPASVRDGDRAAVHGGILLTALDTAACFAVISALGHDCVTLDLRADFVRPATGAEFTATGTLRRLGRRIALADSEISGNDGTVVAVARAQFTWTPDQ